MSTFLHDLFARCVEFQPAFLTLTAIHPDGDRPTPSRHVLLGNTEMLERTATQLLIANAEGWGAYIGVAPRSRDLGRWSRGGKNDLACVPALFVDMDQPDDALIRLGWFDLPASCILHSGRGYHAYWFLETPTVEFARADRAIRGLAQHLGGDEALTIAQSMRLPGTINTKTGRDSAPCSIVRYFPERLYDLSEFEPFMRKSHHDPGRFATWQVHDDPARDLLPSAHEELTEAVLRQLEGRWRSSGYVGARCPFPHETDRPGMHFSYHPESGWGYCFGKHGKIPPVELGRLLGVIVDRPVDAA